MNRIKNTTFFVKLTQWEYWNFYVVYAAVMVYYVWLSIKARTFFFFTASNPGIENSGFIGESKHEIFKKIPSQYLPDYIFVIPSEPIDSLLGRLNSKGIPFPCIAKPNVGERGQGIRKVMDEASLQDYHSKIQVPYIIQSFVDFEIELGVFYYRYPDRSSGKVSSVVQKKFLSVTGDGKSTLRELIMGYPRARFRIGYLEEKFKMEIDAVLPAGKVLELEGIGNHVRGTTFLNANYLINKELNDVFDRISLAIDGFYFGRFDLRCRSLTDLYQGKNIQIMELNGAGAEPAHIYQPGFSFWEGQRVLLSHWKVLFQISQINMANGVKPLTFRQAKAEMKKHALALKSIGV